MTSAVTDSTGGGETVTATSGIADDAEADGATVVTSISDGVDEDAQSYTDRTAAAVVASVLSAAAVALRVRSDPVVALDDDPIYNVAVDVNNTKVTYRVFAGNNDANHNSVETTRSLDDNVAARRSISSEINALGSDQGLAEAPHSENNLSEAHQPSGDNAVARGFPRAGAANASQHDPSDPRGSTNDTSVVHATHDIDQLLLEANHDILDIYRTLMLQYYLVDCVMILSFVCSAAGIVASVMLGMTLVQSNSDIPGLAITLIVLMVLLCTVFQLMLEDSCERQQNIT